MGQRTAWQRTAGQGAVGEWGAGRQAWLERHGHIALLGVQMDRCSALHLAEDRVDLPAAIRRHMAWPVHEAVRLRYPEAAWRVGCAGAWGDFLQVQAEAERRGLVRQDRVGAATVRVFAAAPVVDLYAEMLRADPWSLFGLRPDAA